MLNNLDHTVRRATTHARRVEDTNNNILVEHWAMTGHAVEVVGDGNTFCLDDGGEFTAMVDEMEEAWAVD